MNEPSLLYFLISIAGAAALLIWSAHQVRAGVDDAFSLQLRRFLQRSDRERIQASVTGVFAAICLQSATAVAVLIANFANRGSLKLVSGLAIIFGADLGSAIVSQILIVDRDFIIPLFMLPGVGLYLRGENIGLRPHGRILIGIGLVFISLDMIRAITEPIMGDPAIQGLMGYLSKDLILAFVIGAIFTWLVHSSVASVLFFVTLLGQGILPLNAALALVLGANLGGAFVAYTMTMSSGLAANRIMAVNIVVRGTLALMLLIIMQNLPILEIAIGAPAQKAIIVHIFFNLALVVLTLPFLGGLAKLVERLMPERAEVSDDTMLSTNLDSSTLNNPGQALACALREVLRMGESVEGMLRNIIVLFQGQEYKLECAIKDKVEYVRSTHLEIKQFLAELSPARLNQEERRQADQLASIALNFEFAAEAIGVRLVEQVQLLREDGLSFSREGLNEITDFHDRVLVNSQRALNILVTQAPEEAKRLIKAKEKVRKVERNLQTKHLSRLRDKVPESSDTSRIHQETLRMLKSINTAFAMIGYDIVQRAQEAAETFSSKKKKRN